MVFDTAGLLPAATMGAVKGALIENIPRRHASCSPTDYPQERKSAKRAGGARTFVKEVARAPAKDGEAILSGNV